MSPASPVVPSSRSTNCRSALTRFRPKPPFASSSTVITAYAASPPPTICFALGTRRSFRLPAASMRGHARWILPCRAIDAHLRLHSLPLLPWLNRFLRNHPVFFHGGPAFLNGKLLPVAAYALRFSRSFP